MSGLPDPYTGHDISDELLRQQGHFLEAGQGAELSPGQEQPQHQLEGYSTPSRRVIREIIV